MKTETKHEFDPSDLNKIWITLVPKLKSILQERFTYSTTECPNYIVLNDLVDNQLGGNMYSELLINPELHDALKQFEEVFDKTNRLRIIRHDMAKKNQPTS